jgi:tyrosyl-tRNA synthetase
MIGQRPQQLLLVPILIGTDGSQKMSKSLNNYIGVAEPAEEIYGKVMSIPDSLIIDYFELVTDVPEKELGEFKQMLENETVNPMELKKRLAGEIVSQLYNQKAASEAEGHFKKVVQEKEVPDEIQRVEITEDLLQRIKARSFTEKGFAGNTREIGKSETKTWIVSVPLLLCEIDLVKSRSDAKRLIAQESVRIDGRTICETNGNIKIGSIIKVGQRRWMQMVEVD